MLKRLLLLLTLALPSANLLPAATYYVSTTGSDSANGSSGTPWRTPSTSIAKLVAGNTLIIESGTYAETSTHTFTIAGTSNSPITIQGQNATIDIQASGSQIYSFNGSWIVLDSLNFESTPAGGINNGGALSMNGAYQTVKNCNFHDMHAALIAGNGGDLLMTIQTYGSYTILSNLFIYNITDGDIFRWFGNNVLITSCIISNCTNPNYNYSGSSQLHADMVQVWSAGSAVSNQVFRNNIVINSDVSMGMLEGDLNATLHDLYFYNNLFINEASSAFIGLKAHWFNNIFYNCGSEHGGPFLMYQSSWGDASGSEIENNVSVNSGTVQTMAGSPTYTLKYNYWSGANYSAVSGTIGSPVVNGGNPHFLNEAGYDFHLTTNSTILIGKGTNLSAIFTTDKDGNTRPATGTWDIGAYQFGAARIQEPVISNVQSSPGTNSATITWSTDENANSIVNYGLTFSYGTSITNLSLVTSHSVALSGLTAGTVYHYQVRSIDSTNSLNSSSDFTFTTLGTGGSSSTNHPPVVSAITQNGADIDPNSSGLQIYAGSVVQYSGSASDPDGDSLAWQWIYTVNGGSEVVYQSGTGAVASATFNYTLDTAGNTYVWKLRVSDGSSTSESTLTVGVEGPPVPATGLTFSADSGTITAPFITNSGYIYQTVQTTVVTNGGRASYPFTITNAGNYVVQALVNAPNDAANSVYINMDTEPQDPTMIWDIPLTTGFEERVVSWRGNGTDASNQFVPEIFSLSQGTHTLIIRGREANVQLQNVSILKVPAGPSNLRIIIVP